MRMKDKLAVVTASGSGMGRAGALMFAGQGATVCVVDYNEAAAKAVVEEIRSAGGQAHAVIADLTDAEECKRIIRQSGELMGGITSLWAHHGEPGPPSPENLDLAAYQHAMDLNLRASVLVAGEAMPFLRDSKGAILFTASVSGLVGSPFSPIYSMAKFGIVGLTKSLAMAYGPQGIRVNVVCPGVTDTPMLPGFLSRSGSAAEVESNSEAVCAKLPLRRLGQPEEVAQAALWLLSDEAAYVTGIAVPVDGGYTAG